MRIYGFSNPDFLSRSRPYDLNIRPVTTSRTVRPEATSACVIEVPNMRLMMIGIKKEMPTIGSHFFKKVDFMLDPCYTALFIIFLRYYLSS
jgi:hypothetical protein